MGHVSWPENKSRNFFTARAKDTELVCTKQYNRLFPSARSHGEQMGEGLYKTEVQQIVYNTVKKWCRYKKKAGWYFWDIIVSLLLLN